MLDKRKLTVLWIALAVTMFAAGCKKKAPPPPPPPPPAPVETRPAPPVAARPAPVIAQFTAEPTSIQRGQSSTLRWEVTGDITSVSIDQTIGTVQNVGSRRVFPSESTTYTLTATGPGGSITASAVVAVSSPPAPPPPMTPTGTLPLERRIESDLQDVYFDYDKSDIGGAARDTLTRDAAALKAIMTDFPGASIVVEGHCDERGSAEYNLGLGDRRASAAKDFLVQLGIPENRLKTISYGKERPQCSESTESCWQRNRRAHFSPGQ
ncbi:MAG TPA: OmpA family protein [Bryobacteraceae bacterium]|nr:OmpA family protein [Bryobacteraceae bacterium]